MLRARVRIVKTRTHGVERVIKEYFELAEQVQVGRP